MPGVAQSSCLTAKVKVLGFLLAWCPGRFARDPAGTRQRQPHALLTNAVHVIISVFVGTLDSL